MVRNIVVLGGSSHPSLTETICDQLALPPGNGKHIKTDSDSYEKVLILLQYSSANLALAKLESKSRRVLGYATPKKPFNPVH